MSRLPPEPPAHRADSEADTLLASHRGADAHPIAAPLGPLAFEDRYDDEQPLGEGGMGVVRLTRDRQIGRRVAMKVLRPDCAGDEVLESRFVREARLQGQLEHPSLVPVYDLGITPEGVTYFTMKRVRGLDLGTIIRRLRARDAESCKRYPRRRLLAAISGVCLALDYVHERGVTHRDIKPANIMLGEYGEIYLLDFGLAQLRSDDPRAVQSSSLDISSLDTAKTVAGDVMGTPGYMSPEHVAEGADSVSPLSDVYAMGAVLFEVLALEPLHTPTGIAQVYASTLRGVDARPSRRPRGQNIPPELDAICQQATALLPGERYRGARALHEALEAFLSGEHDVEQRRLLAQEHADRAIRAVDRQGVGGDDEIEARRSAMQDIGRALALDPNNKHAMLALMRVLSVPPAQVPAEVREEIERADRAKMKRFGRFGAIGYVTVFLYLPLLLWLGVRDATALWLFGGLLVPLVGLSTWTAIRPSPPTWIPIVAMALSSVTFACTTPFFGPLVLSPALVAVNTTAFAVQTDGRTRIAVLVMGCLAVIIPIALELGGVTTSYVFAAGGMTIVPRALELPPQATLALLSLSAVAMVLTSALSSGNVRDSLTEAERRLYLFTWHLRELAPASKQVVGDGPDAVRGWEQSWRSGGA